MAEARGDSRWFYRGVFALVAALVLFVRLLPLETTPGRLPGPDVMACLTLAWTLRRPDYVPPVLIAAVFLAEDILTLRAPGLWAATMVLGAEFLRSRAELMREVTFPLEWLAVALVLAGMFLVQRVVLAVVFVPQPPLGVALVHLVVTVLAYPVAVALSHVLLRVRKPATGEVDALGRRP